MNFSEALTRVKRGYKISRTGWNAGGQFVYFVPGGTYPTQTDVAKAEFGETVEYGAYLAIKTVQGRVVPWLASQTDLLCHDWEAVK